MSETAPAPPPMPNLSDDQMKAIVGAVKAVMAEVSAAQAIPASSRVVAVAASLPDMILKASNAAPDLAKPWIGKALLASTTFWGSIGVIVVSALVKRYSLGWDQNTVDVVVGTVDLGILSFLRTISKYPITGLFSAATPAQAAAKATT